MTKKTVSVIHIKRKMIRHAAVKSSCVMIKGNLSECKKNTAQLLITQLSHPYIGRECLIFQAISVAQLVY